MVLDIQRPQHYLVGAFILGFSAISSQIVLLRELMVAFYGNELSTGIVLGGWFFWTGLGGLSARYISVKHHQRVLVLGHGALVFFIPATFILLAVVRSLWGVTGQILSFLPILFTSWSIEIPFCLVSGALFTIYCRVDHTSRQTVDSIGWIYFLDSLGAMSGGFLFSFLFVHFLGPWTFLFVLSGINICLCLLLVRESGVVLKLSVGTLCLFFVSFVSLGGIHFLERFYINKRWSDLEIVRNVYSKYGNIVVTKSEEQINFYENGLFLCAYPDQFTAEENVHLPMLQNQNCQDILIIGGALGGELQEILKYEPRTIEYIELDPTIIDIARQSLPSFNDLLSNTTNIFIHTVDGRYYINRAKTLYDVILINIPDPCNAQINRLYTQEFFQKIKQKLKPGGVVSFKVTSAENYIDPVLGQFLAVIKKTLGSVFPQVLVFPGASNRFFCSVQADLTDRPDLLLERLEARGINNSFVNRFYLPVLLSQERLDYVNRAIAEATDDDVRINRDFSPVSYYYDLVLWSSHFSTWGATFFKMIEKIKLSYLLASTSLLLVPGIILLFFNVKAQTWFIGLPTAVIGFSEIAIEIVLILSFQILYGYTYYKMGLLVTYFMLGLALGSLWVTKWKRGRERSVFRLLLKIQGVMILYPLTIVFVLHGISEFHDPYFLFFSIEILFPLLAVLGGGIGGAHFTLSSKMFILRGKTVSTTASWLYWLDLLGSCVGAVCIGAFFIPLLGINQTMIFVTSLNIVAFGTLIIYKSLHLMLK
ncbi:fused MFS/spermidine synthase [candidate division CSSED10-310 bacterium]|uniref:Polyamine aminopropyltransferase n=1 Tax=candidate division CSSED10-310 bacterium TaxID=2855610 RepID=A0ABV6YWU8_UNCC1